MLRNLLCALALMTSGVTTAVAADAPLPVVGALDLTRYVGTWHEIARYPNYFERMCVRDVTANYTANADGTIRVVNACRKDDGTMTQVDGVARMVTAPAKLQVRFAPDWLAWLPMVWANYWVIDLADDYSYAVVGEPGVGLEARLYADAALVGVAHAEDAGGQRLHVVAGHDAHRARPVLITATLRKRAGTQPWLTALDWAG